jgi:hypothetical protein
VICNLHNLYALPRGARLTAAHGIE